MSKQSLEELKHNYNVYILEISVKENINLDHIFKIFIDDIEMKIISNKMTPCYENGLRVVSNTTKHNFTIDEEQEDKKCCTIL